MREGARRGGEERRGSGGGAVSVRGSGPRLPQGGGGGQTWFPWQRRAGARAARSGRRDSPGSGALGGPASGGGLDRPGPSAAGASPGAPGRSRGLRPVPGASSRGRCSQPQVLSRWPPFYIVLNLFDCRSLTRCLPGRLNARSTRSKQNPSKTVVQGGVGTPRLARASVPKASSPGWGPPPRSTDSAGGKAGQVSLTTDLTWATMLAAET